MKKALFLPLYYSFVCLLIPFCVTSFAPSASTDFSALPTEAPAQTQYVDVYNPVTTLTVSMPLDEYLVGVVAAEMPAVFEPEALKAQAVAARTYTYYKSASHDNNADVCTDHTHCQAYLTVEEMRANWGPDYDLYHEKIETAVYSTTGESLTYNEEPVMAVFHSMGGGSTENCEDVWGTPVPYLVSVPSPGEDAAINYRTTTTLTFEEFCQKITAEYPQISISSFSDISAPVLTKGGHVKSIIIDSVSVPGTKIRSIFNLRSTKFDLSFNEGIITFNVTGYGHGVGMSQYGANAMAKEGKTYKEILSHYYPGTQLSE